MTKRKLSRAVAEDRAPKAALEKDDPVTKLFRELDFFPTCPWAARAIAHRIKQFDPGATTAYDPMCGEGHFADPLKDVFGPANVWASDVYNFGYGEHFDYFDGVPAHISADWFVTNPAFFLAGRFIEDALRRAKRGVAVLCRTSFVETEGRETMLYEGDNPLTCFMPFVERVPMILGRYDPDASTATSYSCFVFHKGRSPKAHQPFMSGTKAHYYLATDPARYAKAAPIPLFERVATPPLFQGGAR
jgi:hypothetical protein